MNISYEYYRIFYYAAKYKNLTQAAEALHNNQPNISRTVRLLEHELGCTLILRSNRGISLTPEGERLYSHVKVAVEHLQTAEEELLQSAGLQEGCVTIGASETALRLLVLPALSHFRKMYPGVHIRILNHLTAQAIESVQCGSVDFAVVVSPENMGKQLISYPIMEFTDILIGGPSYRFPPNQTMTLKESTRYPFVCLGEGTVTRHFYESFYLRHGLMLKPDLEASTTDQILPMVKNDLGIGYIPEAFAKDALEKKEVFRITLSETLPSREICFVESENYPLSAAAGKLKKLLMQKQCIDPQASDSFEALP